jgi:hypothetical protein
LEEGVAPHSPSAMYRAPALSRTHLLGNVDGFFSVAICPQTGAYSRVQTCACEVLQTTMVNAANASLERVVKFKVDRMFGRVSQWRRVYEGRAVFCVFVN